MFEPVGIVGQGCVLPGALSPEQLWDAVLAGRDLLSEAPEGRWGLPRDLALCSPDSPDPDRSWSARGGYVQGFDALFRPEGLALPAADLREADPLQRWLLHSARAALGDLSLDPRRSALIVGNLSFPSAGLARYAEATWLGEAGLDTLRGAEHLAAQAQHRFNSGRPAAQVARALGIEGPAFALDAACASSLYAIALACERLHRRDSDLVLAGAVQGADDLFIHVGFCALQAMSRSGRSRPFHREADGLVPAEGAAMFALKRLADAQRDGDPVLGVIRGVGLSNDGRGRGLLVPSEEGQERALRRAYAAAGLDPEQISLLECHATGTPVGDGVELRSTGAVYAGRSGVPIGSLKSNLGHLITTAGGAALIKVLGAMRAGVKPPTLHVDAPLPALLGSPFRLLTQAEDWAGPQRAGISAFGFGGNNAHLLVEAPGLSAQVQVQVPAPRPEIAVVGLRVAIGESGEDPFEHRLLAERPGSSVVHTVELGLTGLKFPPKDLEQCLGQQTLVLRAALDLSAGRTLPRERTGVFIGAQTDAEVCRYGARWRLPAWRRNDPGWVRQAQEALIPALQAGGVLGTMPNIPANRLNSQLDLGGPGFTVAAEQLSGVRALEIATQQLQAGQLDLALVGAVDLSEEPVHLRALAELGLPAEGGDAAVVLLLKRLDQARADGDEVLAVLQERGAAPLRLDAGPRLAAAHAAMGLLELAAAVVSLNRAVLPGPRPWLGPREASLELEGMSGQRATVNLRAENEAPGYLASLPRLLRFAAADVQGLRAALSSDSGESPGPGPARLALLMRPGQDEAQARAAALGALQGQASEGVIWRAAPLGGELAFVFTGAAASYAGMGDSLLAALPELVDHSFFAPDLLDPEVMERGPDSVLETLWSGSLLCQAHARTLGMLGLRPQAVMGLSSGESNALLATGAWTDGAQLLRDTRESGLFTEALGGEMSAVAQAWGEVSPRWTNALLRGPVESVRDALASEPRVHIAMVYSPRELLISGEADAVERVRRSLGLPSVTQDYALAVHVPELAQVEAAWRALHRRPTTPPPGLRYYSAGRAEAYVPDADSAADAITRQALGTADFSAMVQKAWDDGVRCFVECGPRGLCAGWIHDTLGEREHLALSMDRPRRDGVSSLMELAASLWVAGLEPDLQGLTRRLNAAIPSPTPGPTGPRLRLATHRPPVQLPQLSAAEDPEMTEPETPPWVPALERPEGQRLVAAPWLPPVMDEDDSSEATPAATPAVVAPAVVAPAAAPAVAARSTTVVLPSPVAPPAAPAPWVQNPNAVVWGSWLSQHAQLAAAHRQALAAQQEAHQRFLALRGAMTQTLLHGIGALGQGSMGAPIVPVQARAQAPSAPVPAPTPVSTPAPVPAPAPVSSPTPAPAAPPVVVQAPAPAPVAAPPAASAEASLLTNAPIRRLPPRGPSFTREQLVELSHGQISALFGPQFAAQDAYAVQVRMPEPPLLLADRVLGIDAEPCSMATGNVITETEVGSQTWYLHAGRMPAGVLIEAGQADLLLISYLGIDLLNQGERAYRLLGCELTYHRGLPKVGDTLRYQIHVDGHARQGGIRLFFFHYDSHIGDERMLSVRQGQAGFFTREELDKSMGILWSPETGEHDAQARLDPPALSTHSSFTYEQLRAFSESRVLDCFGPGFERAETHTDTPRIASGRMLLLDHVTQLDPKGGPWGRGYLRAVDPIAPDDWFFQGHFHNDPCMPGTLMFEGCLQAMAFYLTAMGYTVDRDGWRFEPVPELSYSLRCRGQVIPSSKQLIYELFVEEVHDGPFPTLYADLLCTVDGLKAFHCRRMGLRLVPDWPLARLPQLAQGHEGTVAVVDGFPFDYASLMSCAWGRPSLAFGPMYQPFDSTRKVARLPGSPYHFMSRVASVDGPIGVCQPGAVIELEYDIPQEAWYFLQNGSPTMPFAVLLEAALQPCGWLASFVGSALTTQQDLYFRNLDGTGTWTEELLPGHGVLRTRVKITKVSQSGGMIIQAFQVNCTVDGRSVYTMDTVFGFFPKVALDNQIGLPTTDAQRALLSQGGGETVDLRRRPARYCGGELRLPGPMLLMLDRVSFWPEGGAAGLGLLRGEKDVDPQEWFFKAHFFGDPVQPGSLGLEALVQLLQAHMLHCNMAEGIVEPRFEPLMLDRPMTWKYRGQVVPKNKLISSTLEIVERGTDERGPFVIGKGSLWVDGKRIYEASNIGMRVQSGRLADPHPIEVLDPTRDTWVHDHSPTFTVPALPMMSLVDRIAAAAARLGEGRVVSSLEDLRVRRWAVLRGPLALQSKVEGRWERMEVSLSDDAGLLASGAVRLRLDHLTGPQAWAPCEGVVQDDPYAAGRLFHGPSFRLMRRWVLGAQGSSALLDPSVPGVPRGHLHQALLDAMTHGIPHDELWRWSERIPKDVAAYPAWIPHLRLYGVLPSAGELRAEARFVGFPYGPELPTTDVQLIRGDEVLAELRLVEALFPKGPIGCAPPEDRQRFLRERLPVPGLALSQLGEETVLDPQALRASDWLPGTVAAVYGLPEGIGEAEAQTQIAVKDHLAQRLGVHPSLVQPLPGGALSATQPLTRWPLQVEGLRVRDAGPPVFDSTPVAEWWDRWFKLGRWPVEDLFYGLSQHFVRSVHVEDPQALARYHGRPLLFLANHQTGIESLMFSILASGLTGLSTVTLAKIEHRHTWLGRLIQLAFSWPEVQDPKVITYFDREDKASLPGIIQELAGEMMAGTRSVMVHIEGTRSLECRTPVQKMSGAFIDMALAVGAAVVPVRFTGGLPVEPLTRRIEYPVGFGTQDIWLGKPITSAEFKRQPYGPRKDRVIAAINALGPKNSEEQPNPPDPALGAAVAQLQERLGVDEEHATLLQVLRSAKTLHPDLQGVLAALDAGVYTPPSGPRGAWLAELASRLFGPRGPRVVRD